MSIVLDYNNVDKFVDEQVARNNDVRWEGWSLIFFRESKNSSGWSKREGAYRKNNWGFETRIAVDSDGRWRIPNRNVKHS